MRTGVFRNFVCLLGILAAPGAFGQNLVQNPGFQSGNLSGWTTSGNVAVEAAPYSGDFTSPALPPRPYTVSGAPDGGSYFALMSPLGHGTSTLSQNLGSLGPITAPVTVSFDYDLISGASELPDAKVFSLSVGGDTIFSRQYIPSPADSQTGWETESITLTSAEVAAVEAHGANLEFTWNPDFGTGAAAVDNVSLTVPDSNSTLLLLLIVVPGLFVCRRKVNLVRA